MKIILNPAELEAALLRHYPALANHRVTGVDVKMGYNNGPLETVEITMTPVEDKPPPKLAL